MTLSQRFWRLFNPFGVGRRVFTPSRPDRVQDPVVKKIQVIRTVVGFVVVVWMLVSSGLVAADDGAVIDDRLNQMQVSLIALAVTFPIVVAGFIAAARPPNRRLLLRRAGKPAGALLVLVGSLALPRVITASGYAVRQEWHADPESFVTLAAYIFFLVWFSPFLLYGVGQSIVHVFRTADIHETIPPLLAILLVWELAILDVIKGAYEGVPFWVRLALTLGAPVSVTAVAMWELRRLRNLHGITPRGALLR